MASLSFHGDPSSLFKRDVIALLTSRGAPAASAPPLLAGAGAGAGAGAAADGAASAGSATPLDSAPSGDNIYVLVFDPGCNDAPDSSREGPRVVSAHLTLRGAKLALRTWLREQYPAEWLTALMRGWRGEGIPGFDFRFDCGNKARSYLIYEDGYPCEDEAGTPLFDAATLLDTGRAAPALEWSDEEWGTLSEDEQGASARELFAYDVRQLLQGHERAEEQFYGTLAKRQDPFWDFIGDMFWSDPDTFFMVEEEASLITTRFSKKSLGFRYADTPSGPCAAGLVPLYCVTIRMPHVGAGTGQLQLFCASARLPGVVSGDVRESPLETFAARFRPSDAIDACIGQIISRFVGSFPAYVIATDVHRWGGGDINYASIDVLRVLTAEDDGEARRVLLAILAEPHIESGRQGMDVAGHYEERFEGPLGLEEYSDEWLALRTTAVAAVCRGDAHAEAAFRQGQGMVSSGDAHTEDPTYREAWSYRDDGALKRGVLIAEHDLWDGMGGCVLIYTLTRVDVSCE